MFQPPTAMTAGPVLGALAPTPAEPPAPKPAAKRVLAMLDAEIEAHAKEMERVRRARRRPAQYLDLDTPMVDRVPSTLPHGYQPHSTPLFHWAGEKDQFELAREQDQLKLSHQHDWQDVLKSLR